jgi:hypothetical protein
MPLKHAVQGCKDSSGLVGVVCASFLADPCAAAAAAAASGRLSRLRAPATTAGLVALFVFDGVEELIVTGPRPNVPAGRGLTNSIYAARLEVRLEAGLLGCTTRCVTIICIGQLLQHGSVTAFVQR